MKMFVTGIEFVKNGTSYPGIPFLIDQDMRLVPAPNQYLRHISINCGRTSSSRTWLTYGNHLYEYFAFLEANVLLWDSVNPTQIAAWRDKMLARGCKRSTVNQRLRCVHTFYQWALRNGITHSLPFDTKDIWVAKPRGFLAHVDASGGRFAANELTLQTHKPIPKFLHLDKSIRYLDALSPHRLKLMGYLMLLTGMRREEVVGLDCRVVPNPAGNDPGKHLPMELDATLTPTKGNKNRIVMLPYDLAVALWNYLTWSRPKLAAKFKRNHGCETTRFFLSELGEELSIRHLNNTFAKASAKTCIRCNPHMLRHTYGTYELLRMTEKVGESKALLWVRDRMGHSSITTTEIYVHAADLAKHDDVDGFQLEICQALRNGH
jgi:site-specific recombinase XerD